MFSFPAKNFSRSKKALENNSANEEDGPLSVNLSLSLSLSLSLRPASVSQYQQTVTAAFPPRESQEERGNTEKEEAPRRVRLPFLGGLKSVKKD